ncbi:hypothetical protein [Pseudomonas sp. 273]|uniref:hypothetical protein n=1 Tax=Pseudomonas sp. 273 TaxID=75692 RepID=UPI0023D8A4EF|nr:hypothetical protein [Pseudomonas sp. 273]
MAPGIGDTLIVTQHLDIQAAVARNEQVPGHYLQRSAEGVDAVDLFAIGELPVAVEAGLLIRADRCSVEILAGSQGTDRREQGEHGQDAKGWRTDGHGRSPEMQTGRTIRPVPFR